jgi:hypothetical protein
MSVAMQQKKRLREGGVGPEMRSPAGLTGLIMLAIPCPVKPVDRWRST